MGKKIENVRDILISVFNEYDWEKENYLIENSKYFCYAIFDKIIFQFHLDRMYNSISCEIQERNNFQNRKMDLEELVDYRLIKLNNSPLYDDFSNIDIEHYIIRYVTIINHNLMETIKGDTTLFDRVLAIRENTSFIQSYYNEDFVFDSVAYNKMINGDEDWKESL